MKKGFTLIELMVVLAIISILIAILLPSLRNAREAGNAVVCLNQQRQMGLAIMLYSNDYRNYVPNMTSGHYYTGPTFSETYLWLFAIHPYLTNGQIWDGGGPDTSKAFFCPTGEADIFRNASNRPYTNYMYNGRIGFLNTSGVPLNDSYRSRKVDNCRQPSQCVLMVDGKNRAMNRYHFDVHGSTAAFNHFSLRHAAAANTLYADGRAAAVKIEGLPEATFQNFYSMAVGNQWP